VEVQQETFLYSMQTRSAFIEDFMMKSLRTCCYWIIILHTGKYTRVTGEKKLSFVLSTNLGCCWVS